MFHEGTCNLDEYNIIGRLDFTRLCISSTLVKMMPFLRKGIIRWSTRVSAQSSELGPPTLCPASECSIPPPGGQDPNGGDTLAYGEGGPIQTTGRKLWYSIIVIPLRCPVCYYTTHNFYCIFNIHHQNYPLECAVSLAEQLLLFCVLLHYYEMVLLAY